jgi:aspartate/methionine/tyrosine aminotransferase
MATGQSTFLHWAKTRPKPTYDLALSGVLNLPFDELDIHPGDLELHGDNAYGYPPLVNAIASHCEVVPENVVTISGGTSMANHLAMASVLERDDEVLIEEPTYEPILAVVKYLGGRIKRFQRPFENNYTIDTDELAKKITSRTRMIILTNLHNPSSVLIGAETMSRIGELAHTVGARVLVDEVYLESVFDKKPRSAISHGRQFIATSSLTKGYGLSGLRCGWILAEPALAEKMRRLNDIFGAVGSYVIERLSVIALRQLSQVKARAKQLLETNRTNLNNFFDARADLEVVRTEFGTTSFPRLHNGQADKLCQVLEEQYQTALVPGRFFDSPQHVRIGLCCQPESFAHGLENLGRALDSL